MMESVLKGDSKSMYSWWRDSHIRPKNSKWLQENLTDMDSKVEQMIKVIEEDADTFSRRAKMYYEKRPELIKLIEELYRAYRALAERYAHATGIIGNVHCRLGDVFPSQNLLFSGNGSPAISNNNVAYSKTPLIPHPVSELVGPGELQIDALGVSSSHFYATKRNEGFTDEPVGISITEAEFVALENSLAKLESNTGPQEEVQKFKEENKNLNELNLSSAALVKSLREEISSLRQTIKKLEEDMEFRLTWMRLHRVLPELEIEVGLGLKDENIKDQRVVQDETVEDQSVVHKLMKRLDEMQSIFSEIQDENQCSLFEKSVLVVLLSELKSEAAVIATEKSILDQEFRIQCQQLSSLQSETRKLVETNEELRSKLKEGGCREELLKAEIENLFREVSELQRAYRNLQEENQKNMDEKLSLTNSVACLEEDSHKLEDEAYLMLSESVYQSCLSLIFKGIIMDKLLEMKMRDEDLGRLHYIRDKQEKKLGKMEEKLKEVQSELFSVRSVNDQLTQEIATEKNLLSRELNKERSEVKSWECQATLKDAEINQLKEKVMSLEDDKGKLKEKICKYSQAAVLLNDGFKSLENIISSSHKSEDDIGKDADLVINPRLDNHPQKDEFPDVQELSCRIEAVVDALIEGGKLKIPEKTIEDSQHEAMMKEIEVLTTKTGRSHMQHEEEDIRNQKQSLEIYEDVREIITKDIMLDQVSDSSISRRIYHSPEFLETSGQTSWFDSELDDQDKCLSEESLVIEETEIHGSSQQLNSQNVLKSLDVDLQTLGNLQVTIQELKNKVETNKKLQKNKGIEPDTIKAQLVNADAAILNLFDVNQKLMMKVEKGFEDSNEEEKARGRWISVQANRASERIGRLQLEIRRIQQFLMKLDSVRISEGKRRVLLKDYINGGPKIKHTRTRRKLLFACLRPKSP